MELYKVYRQAGKNQPVDLTVGGKKYLALIKDATFEPRKNQLRHVVFNAIKRNQKVTAQVPVIFTGDAEAEKAGYMILRQLDAVEIEALPSDLPAELPIDISTLAQLGDKLHVSDIPLPKGVALLTEPEHALALVEESAAKQAAEAEEAEKAAEAEAAAAESGEAPAGDTAEEQPAAETA
jgi:large subunit ribosomal protein L25